MKRIKKILPLVMSAIMSVCVFAGCGGENKDKDYLLFYVWGDNTDLSWYEQIAADFKVKTGVTVKVDRATGVYYDNLNINLGSRRNAPDIFFTEPGEFLSMISGNRLLNLSPYIQSGAVDIKSADNPDGAIELWDVNNAYRHDGTSEGTGDYYALIKDWSPDFMLWYNKSHIDEYNEANSLTETDAGFMEYPSETVPMTWDEFLDMSHKLTKRSGSTVTRWGTMLDRVPYKHLMEFIQMTGEKTFIDGKYFNTNAKGVSDAFNFFAALQKGDKASSPEIGPSGFGSGEGFANGNVSCVWFGNWGYPTYHWDSLSFEFGIAPPPVPAKGRPLTEDDCYTTSPGMIALGINAGTPLKDEAVSFLNYYMIEGAEFMAAKGFNMPGNKAVAESDTYLYPESAELGRVNRYFLDAALNYTDILEYNRHISQNIVESVFGKNLTSWLKNYNPASLPQVLADIERDIFNEID
jgi:multiple sugar transport system substrate-binding protein